MEQTRSRRDFNRYLIDYHPFTIDKALTQMITIETITTVKSYPIEVLPITCYIYDYLLAKGETNIAQHYDLSPFSIPVQTLDRTFIDKVFALADYYISGKITGHSRHIYDLYKIYPKISFDDTFINLVKEIRNIRKSFSTCYSAFDGIDISLLLHNIITENTYSNDYEQNTTQLLYEELPYCQAIKVLTSIIDDGCFA